MTQLKLNPHHRMYDDPPTSYDGNAPMMRCVICSNKLKVITNSHLKRHGMTPGQYIEQYGSVAPSPKLTTVERFWLKVDKTETCWLWKATKRDGYGLFNIGKKKLKNAHRISWTLHYGSIPEHLCVLHKCDVRNCVNPSHLFLGTKKDNREDALKKGRLKSCPGEKNGQAKLKLSDIVKIRNLYKCKTITQRQLATCFSISQSQIHFITSGKKWKEVQQHETTL